MLGPTRPPRAIDFDDRFDGTDCPACGDDYDPALVSVLWPDQEASRDVFATHRLCLSPADGDIRALIDAHPEDRYEDSDVLIAIEHTVSDELTPRKPADVEDETETASETTPTPSP